MKKKTKCVLVEEHRVDIAPTVAVLTVASSEDISLGVTGADPINSIVQDLDAKTTLLNYVGDTRQRLVKEKCERITEPVVAVKPVKKRVVRRKKNQDTVLIDNESTVVIDSKATATVDKENANPPLKKKKKKRSGTKRFKDEASEVRYDKRSRTIQRVVVDETKKLEASSSGISHTNDALLNRNISSHEDEAGDDASNFSGNEDDRDSVVSAILDEDICIACGLSTMVGTIPVENVILCDGCDGEYHMQCEGLQSVPEGTFTCRRCVEDGEHYRHLPFDMPYAFSVQSETVNRSKDQRSVVYSAGRPIERAWEDCQRRGVMIVSNVFSRDIMR
jgi:hypothetical protein